MDQTLQGPTGGALTEPVAVSDRLPELRGMFERILCVARSSDQKPIGNIELADRLIKAVVSWGASGAALAQPEPEVVGPSDEELLELWKGWNLGWDPRKGTVLMPHPAEYARAVLARWGRPAPALAEGEVAELVEWLRGSNWNSKRQTLATRAADLLERQATACAICERERLHQSTRAADLEVERQAAPVPVAVSDRLPQPEDMGV